MDLDDPDQLNQSLFSGTPGEYSDDPPGTNSPIGEAWYEEEEIFVEPCHDHDGEYEEEEDPLCGAEPGSERSEFDEAEEVEEEEEEEFCSKALPASLSAASVMSMAESVGCNIPEDVAQVLGDLAMHKLRQAVLMASQFRRHELSFGLTVEQFSKAESIMSVHSVGSDSCLASPSFKYVGNTVSTLEEDKLIDVHRTFKKLPTSGSRKKPVEHNIVLNVHKIYNTRGETRLDGCPAELNDATVKYNSTHSPGFQERIMHPDSDSSLCSDSDDEFPFNNLTNADDEFIYTYSTQAGDEDIMDADISELRLHNSNESSRNLDMEFLGNENSKESSANQNEQFQNTILHPASEPNFDATNYQALLENSSPKSHSPQNNEEVTIEVLDAQEHQDQDTEEMYEMNDKTESPEASKSPFNGLSNDACNVSDSEEVETETVSNVSDNEELVESESRSPCGSGSESTISDSSRSALRRKENSEHVMNQLTELLEDRNWELAEHMLSLRLELLLEKILILNDEDISEDDNEDEVTDSDVELEFQKSPVDRDVEVERSNEADSPGGEAESIVENMEEFSPDMNDQDQCNNPDSGIVDAVESSPDALRTASRSEGRTSSEEAFDTLDPEIGIEWVDYMKIFVSTFFYCFEEIDVCITENLVGTSSKFIAEQASGMASRNCAQDEARIDCEESHGELFERQASSSCNTDVQVDVNETEEITQMETRYVEVDISADTTDTKEADIDGSVDSTSYRNQSTEGSGSIDERLNIEPPENYRKLMKEVQRMKQEHERIISDISAHGVYQVFSVINCFFHDYMRAKFGYHTIGGLRKILDVVSASLHCPVQPSDHHLRQMCSILTTMLTLPAPCELHQYIARVFIQVQRIARPAFWVDVMGWMCNYISRSLEWYTNSCFHNVQYKTSAFNSALSLVNALENAGMRVTLHQDWHSPILKFIDGSQMMRSKLNELRRRPAPEKVELLASNSSNSLTYSKDNLKSASDTNSEWSDVEDETNFWVDEMDRNVIRDFAMIEENIVNFLRIILTNYKKNGSTEVINKIQRAAAEHFGHKMAPVMSRYQIFDPSTRKKRKQRQGNSRNRYTSAPSWGSEASSHHKSSKYRPVFEDSPLTALL